MKILSGTFFGTRYMGRSQKRRDDQGKQPCYRQILPGTSGIRGSTRNAPGSPKPKILHVGLAAPLLTLRFIQVSGIVDITIQCCWKSYFFKAHHNGLFDSTLLNACPALIRVRFLKNCHYDFKCCDELVDANDFENIYLEHMMANAWLTSLQTVFSMFMVRTPNPRPFTFTRSVLEKELR